MHRRAMKHSPVLAFLSGDLSPEALTGEISDEFEVFYADLAENHYGFIETMRGPEIFLGRAGARRLLTAITANRMPATVAVYVADCIASSVDVEFADEATREAIGLIEDDSRRFIDEGQELWTKAELAIVLASLDVALE